jgi:hypothetical protein
MEANCRHHLIVLLRCMSCCGTAAAASPCCIHSSGMRVSLATGRRIFWRDPGPKLFIELDHWGRALPPLGSKLVAVSRMQ